MFYVLMCLHVIALAWRPATGMIYQDRPTCMHERLQISSGACRCESYVVVLEQRGDD